MDIGIAPMVDLVFILLIFFAATYKITERKKINIDVPSSSAGDSLNQKQISIFITQALTIHSLGKKVMLYELEDFLRAEKAKTGARLCLVNCHKEVSTWFLVKVMDKIKASGLRIAIAVKEESTK